MPPVDVGLNHKSAGFFLGPLERLEADVFQHDSGFRARTRAIATVKDFTLVHPDWSADVSPKAAPLHVAFEFVELIAFHQWEDARYWMEFRQLDFWFGRCK